MRETYTTRIEPVFDFPGNVHTSDDDNILHGSVSRIFPPTDPLETRKMLVETSAKLKTKTIIIIIFLSLCFLNYISTCSYDEKLS